MKHMSKDARTARQISAFTIPVLLLLGAWGCDSSPKPYGRENKVVIAPSPGAGAANGKVWAISPTINLSGQRGVDPLLQSDLCYQQLQQVQGLTVIPVDKVVSVYVSLGIDKVQSPEQAAVVCDLLGADGLIVPTVTAWEPYNPPKMGASMVLFAKPAGYARPNDVDPRQLIRQAAPTGNPGAASNLHPDGTYQAVGMFDAANGSVRESLARYAYGRADPLGPYGDREYLVSSDKYATFVWRRLMEQLLDQLYSRVGAGSGAGAAGTGGAGGGGGGEGKSKKEESSNFPEGGPAGPQPFPSNRR
jgi:hypothetical protein